MKNLREHVELEASSLEVGQQVRTMCPVCCSQHEPISFWIKRFDEGIQYKCWRASCPTQGFIGVRYSSDTVAKPKPKSIRKYQGQLEKLPDEITTFLKDKFWLTDEELISNRVLWNPYRRTVVFTLYNQFGYPIGYCDRSYEGREPKSLTYWEHENEPMLYYPDGTVNGEFKHDYVAVVEDVVSAIRMSRFIPCIAFLGTNITSDTIKFVAKHSSNLLIALDYDAINLSLQYKKRFGLYFKQVKIFVNKKDPKDTEPNELKELVEKVICL